MAKTKQKKDEWPVVARLVVEGKKDPSKAYTIERQFKKSFAYQNGGVRTRVVNNGQLVVEVMGTGVTEDLLKHFQDVDGTHHRPEFSIEYLAKPTPVLAIDTSDKEKNKLYHANKSLEAALVKATTQLQMSEAKNEDLNTKLGLHGELEDEHLELMEKHEGLTKKYAALEDKSKELENKVQIHPSTHVAVLAHISNYADRFASIAEDLDTLISQTSGYDETEARKKAKSLGIIKKDTDDLSKALEKYLTAKDLDKKLSTQFKRENKLRNKMYLESRKNIPAMETLLETVKGLSGLSRTAKTEQRKFYREKIKREQSMVDLYEKDEAEFKTEVKEYLEDIKQAVNAPKLLVGLEGKVKTEGLERMPVHTNLTEDEDSYMLSIYSPLKQKGGATLDLDQLAMGITEVANLNRDTSDIYTAENGLKVLIMSFDKQNYEKKHVFDIALYVKSRAMEAFHQNELEQIGITPEFTIGCYNDEVAEQAKMKYVGPKRQRLKQLVGVLRQAETPMNCKTLFSKIGVSDDKTKKNFWNDIQTLRNDKLVKQYDSRPKSKFELVSESLDSGEKPKYL